MPSSRSTFSCGHRGFGSYCHRCEQAKVLKQRAIDFKKAVPDKAELMRKEAERLAGPWYSKKQRREMVTRAKEKKEAAA